VGHRFRVRYKNENVGTKCVYLVLIGSDAASQNFECLGRYFVDRCQHVIRLSGLIRPSATALAAADGPVVAHMTTGGFAHLPGFAVVINPQTHHAARSRTVLRQAVGHRGTASRAAGAQAHDPSQRQDPQTNNLHLHDNFSVFNSFYLIIWF
jgi:hypothetical protein